MSGKRIRLTGAESKFLAAHMRGEKGTSRPQEQNAAIGYSKIRKKRAKKGKKTR
tara:strand:+ start:311 stop:472 length:162 start_codon:yes stop_codon:yes gene_type:complete